MRSRTDSNSTNTGPFRVKVLNFDISSVSLSVLLVCAISLLVLIGWLFEIDLFKRIVPGYVFMNPTTALGLIGLSLALWLSQSGRAAWVRLSIVFAGVAALIGLLKLSAMAGLFDLGIDQLFFRGQQFDAVIGRQNEMSPQTALNLILLGIAILLLNTRSKRLREVFPSQYLAIAAFISSALAIIGYLYGAKSFYVIVSFNPMAIHTAIAILVLSTGLLLSKPNQGIVEELLSDNAGGKMARRLIPVVILIPAVLGWLRLYGERHEYYRNEMGTSMLVVAIIVILGAVVLGNARTMNNASVRRQEIENALKEATLRERAIIQNAPDIICTVDAIGNFTTINPACFKVLGYQPEELIGKPFIDFVVPEDVAETSEIALEIMSGIEARGFENRYLHKNGSLVDMNWTAFWSNADQLMFSIAHDVTEQKKVHQSLHKDEIKFRELLEAAPDAMVVVNADGEIVLLNVQAEKQFGYRRDELVGQKVTNIIPEGFAERLVADDLRSASEALAQQIGMGIELIALRKNGTEFPIEIMLSPLDSADGILVTAAIRDISSRKKAERYLARMEGRYRGLMEAAPDAMVVVNEFGAIVLVNVQAEKQFGYSRNELIGQKMTNLIPEGFAERLVADDLRTAAEALAQQIGTGIELSALRKDGTEFPIEIMLSPLDSEDGILVTAAIRDISVRRAADLAVVQMESRYRGLLEAAPDAMVVVNQEGEIVLVNVQAEKQFGYLRDELVGQKVTNIIPEGFAERLVADALRSDEDALAQSIGTGIELTALRNDGSEFPIELMLSPLDSDDGMLVTAAIRDITGRRLDQLNLLNKVDELKRSNEELDQFASVASHDLQEPLRMVASYTQLLSRRYTGQLDADADEFIAFAVDGADRMQRLIKDLLDYSRVGTKGKELLNTSSEAALEQGLLNLRGAIEDSKALVTHDPLPDVMADETQLIQLFQNLIGNGIKYQKAGDVPVIHISAQKQKDENWTFSVRDNGLGIEPVYFTRIFGMFQRLHKRDEFVGTGIGLAICKKIVERHGGRISVESKPGEGSTFLFGLSASGTQPDGIEAMAFLNKEGEYSTVPRPDFILLDLNLPKMDGLEVLQQIKSSDDLKIIPTVILTTSDAENDILKSYQYQANCFFTKPVQLDKFVD